MAWKNGEFGFHGVEVAALWLAAVLWGAGAGGMTLEEAVEVALENNRELARAGLEVQGLAVARDEARARVRALEIAPAGRAEAGSGTTRREVGLEGSWTGPQGTVLGASAGGREWEFEGGESTRRGEVVLSVEQPLFRKFGRLAQEEPAVLADEGWRAARRSLERRRSQLAVDVAEAFEGVLWLEEQAGSERESIGRLERLAALSGVKERRGESTRSDTLRLEWQRGGAETRLETVLGMLEVRRRELADLLGGDGAELPELEPPPLLRLETGDGDAAVETALRERPEVAQAAADAASAARQERLAKRELLPDVWVAASQRFYGEGEDWSDAGELDEDEWTVGVGARMNLARREARLAVEKAKTDVLAAEAALDAVKRRVALEARTALADYRSRSAECALAEENRARAEGRAELASALFEAGRGSADRVADAEADAVTSRLAAHEARREASVAAYRLLHALGTLVPVPEELLR